MDQENGQNPDTRPVDNNLPQSQQPQTTPEQIQQPIVVSPNASQLPVPQTQPIVYDPTYHSDTSKLTGQQPQHPSNSFPSPIQSIQPIPTDVQAQQNSLTPPQIQNTVNPQNQFQSQTQNYNYTSFNTSQYPSGKNSKRRKIFILTSLSIALILLGGAALIFGYYIPNKPENVWATGINRTGLVIEKLTDSATEQEKLNQLQKSEIQANFEAEFQGTKYAGTFNANYDPSKGNYRVTYSSQEGQELEQKLEADLMAELSEGATFPDIFFRVSGISSLGLDTFYPGIAEFEGKWIHVDQAYYKTLVGEESTQQTEEPTSAEYVQLAKIISDTTKEYVFSTQQDKYVLERREIVGKESSEGQSTYRYKAGINKQNAKDYCKTLANRVIESAVYKKYIPESNPDEDKKAAAEECNRTIDTDIKDTDTFDIWVDRKTKIIQKVRITEKGKDIYTEFGQIYKGGDTSTLFVGYHNGVDTIDGRLSVDLNFKDITATGTLTIKGGEGDNRYDVKATMSFKPYNGEINVAKPDNAIPINDLLNKLNIENGEPATDLFGSDDNERQTDINALHSQLEAHYATNGYYPNREQLNDQNWAAINLPGIDPEALRDPAGTENRLTESANENHYGYEVSGCHDSNTQCQSYNLTALLNDGTIYAKAALN